MTTRIKRAIKTKVKTDIKTEKNTKIQKYKQYFESGSRLCCAEFTSAFLQRKAYRILFITVQRIDTR